MEKKVQFLGLDVHAERIAVADPEGEVRSLGMIANRPGALRKLIRKLDRVEGLPACYEAGPEAGVAEVGHRHAALVAQPVLDVVRRRVGHEHRAAKFQQVANSGKRHGVSLSLLDVVCEPSARSFTRANGCRQ